MVYRGPSQGCRPCRQRKIKCPAEQPVCAHCIRRKVAELCIYDRSGSAFVEGLNRSRRAVKTSVACGCIPETTRLFTRHDGKLTPLPATHQAESPLKSLSQDDGFQALCFFTAFYAAGPREWDTNVWAQDIIPRLPYTHPESALTLAMTAVSMQVMDKERLGTLVSPRAQAFYTRGVVAMRELLHGELTCNYDEVLTGIFMLEIYEILSAIGLESVHSAVHQNAGMRIMKRASTLNIDTRPTAPIAVALQSRYIYACLSAGLPTPLCTRLDDFVAFPGVGGKLDSFAAEVADLLYERRIILNRSPQASSPNTTSFLTPSATPETPASSTASTDLAPSTAAVLLLRTISLLTRLQSWYASLPPSWHRHRLPPTSNIHSTIRISSIYAGLCDVYTSLPISHSLGMYRVLRIASLQTRHLLETHLSHNQNSSTTPDTYADTDVLAGANSQPEVQALVDDLCAAVPFHLGNRGHPLEALVGTLYPPTPDWLRRKARFVDQYGAATEMTDLHHAAEAASRGGFMILMPLLGVLQLFVGGDVEGQLGQEDAAEAETGAGGGRRRRVRGNPFKLRDGQLMWMQAQVMRTSQLLLKPSVA